ncbi:MAG TPA: ABC-ATPase domain-containing protein, partial [Sandaracinaceae bacterium LLY-WYZ-13_1]|nr:ABC-ATPase domain-containing protein [Sandaracinaceae bacterium LLY-WYZ-13_1]
SGKSGRVSVDAGGAEVLARSGCVVHDDRLELRFRVGLPAKGRSILGRAAAGLLARDLPRALEAVRWASLDAEEVREQVLLVEDHHHLRDALAGRGLVAFVRDGSILPRSSGVSSEPLEGAVPFESPASLRVTLPTLHHGDVTGMGVPEGVTLLVGGGFHGKTTLLEALQLGVYPHVPGDGREWVVTRADAVKVRSEDGRSVADVDLRPFIHDLPRGRSTASFRTPDASGSTSLAAGILESMELGAGALLMDEDTCATNLLVRDARMQRLVQHETIVPLIDRVRELHRDHGVSTVLALGGSGDYLEVADTVVMMDAYLPHDVTARGREVAAEVPTGRAEEASRPPLAVTERCPVGRSFDARAGKRERVRSRGTRELTLGRETIELSAVEQLVDDSQVRAIGALLKRAHRVADGDTTLASLVAALIAHVEREGWVAVDDSPELAMPRALEVGAAINRLRALRVSQS